VNYTADIRCPDISHFFTVHFEVSPLGLANHYVEYYDSCSVLFALHHKLLGKGKGKVPLLN